MGAAKLAHSKNLSIRKKIPYTFGMEFILLLECVIYREENNLSHITGERPKAFNF